MIVSTATGDVRGISAGGVHAFLGVPYATADRFAPPAPAPAWTGVRDADTFGPIAPQPPSAQFLSGELPQSEDCLSLNVWTPDPSGARPVMVWIHGGAFRQGASASPLYDGAPLAAHGDVVVVSINYRLGALGFLAHPDLAADDGTAANWGLLDQVAALRWVQHTIAAFGGDPGNVTIFGESAGGASVGLLTVAPPARGLFQKAIAQSGPAATAPLERSTGRAEKLAAKLGVTVAALRDVPTDALLGAQAALEVEQRAAMQFVPSIDGMLLDRPPLDAIRDGAAAGIPTIIGTNVDEWKLFAPIDRHARRLDEERLRRRLAATLDGGVDDVLDTFRRERETRGEGTSPADLWFAIESDRFFRVPALRRADAHVAHTPDTFVYLFGWRSPAMRGWLGACHGLEIAFVFGTQGRPGLAKFTGEGPAADALGAQMLDAWAAFAHTGNPSTPALPWPAHEPTTRPTMVFDTTSRVEHAPRDAERAVVDRYALEPMR